MRLVAWDDIVEQQLDMGMEPTRESLRLSITDNDEDTATLRVGRSRGKTLGTHPSVTCSMSWAVVSTMMGTGQITSARAGGEPTRIKNHRWSSGG